ncbi:hypothetical protein FJZ17_03030 [Candidatus Pacearchaeota archaeon]|nr:hypothetical protein [Candidatus Pacearchaeota archaeon]
MARNWTAMDCMHDGARITLGYGRVFTKAEFLDRAISAPGVDEALKRGHSENNLFDHCLELGYIVRVADNPDGYLLVRKDPNKDKPIIGFSHMRPRAKR